MIDSRRIPKPKSRSTWTPQSSGPRCSMVSQARAIAASATGCPPRRYHPAMPHMARALAGRVRSRQCPPLHRAYYMPNTLVGRRAARHGCVAHEPRELQTMATTPTETATASKLELTPPEPVPTIAPEQAVGLVPVSEDNKSKLEAKVDAFVADLVAQDAASPEFGKRVDALTNMGRKEIAAAAAMSNRFLDRPVRAMDKETGVGTDLAELRRTVEELDPGRQGKLSSGRKLLGIIPLGNKLKN